MIGLVLSFLLDLNVQKQSYSRILQQLLTKMLSLPNAAIGYHVYFDVSPRHAAVPISRNMDAPLPYDLATGRSESSQTVSSHLCP